MGPGAPAGHGHGIEAAAPGDEDEDVLRRPKGLAPAFTLETPLTTKRAGNLAPSL